MAVVGGEGDGEDIIGVANESASGGTGGELPEAEGLVPGGGEGIGAVGRDDLIPSIHIHLNLSVLFTNTVRDNV